MSVPKDPNDTKGQPTEREVSRGRHMAQCSICKHPQREEIEETWLNWTGLATIEFKYKVSRDSVYRHAHALGLFSKRRSNLIPSYERIVERGDTISYSGSNIISALRELEKLIQVEKAAEAVQSADPKPASQETPAKESDNGVVAGSLVTLLDEMPGAQPGQGQNEEKEPQGPEPTDVQQVETKGSK